MRVKLRVRHSLVCAIVFLLAGVLPHLVGFTGTASSASPSITLTPASYDFGSLSVGSTSNNLDLNIKNSSSSGITLNSITVTGDFAISNFCGGSLSSGFSCDVWVRFVPTASGTRTGLLTVNDSAPDSPHKAVLKGTGTGGSSSSAPAVSLSTTSLNFGNQQVGTSSAQSVILTNSGNSSLSISRISTSGDFSQANNCGNPISSGSGCTINVVFSPNATGNRNGTLSISDNASGSPHTVSLAGTGTTAPPSSSSNVTLTPSTYDFGSVAVGSTSNNLDVFIKNISSSGITLNSITITGDFALTNFCGGSLAPGFSCDAWVRFVPTASGFRTGLLIVNDSAPDSPHRAVLRGTGGGGGGSSGSGPGVSLSASNLSFGNQPVGTSSSAQNVTLTNSGNSSLSISQISTSGDFSETNNCGSTISSGSGCTIDVIFSPNSTGSRNGTLSISDNASGSPHTVSLAGVGTTSSPPPVADKHYLYIAGNGGAVNVYDIDNGHALVQTISLSQLSGSTPPLGVGACVGSGMLYISYGGFGGSQGNGSLLAYDLVHNQLAWTRSYSHGVDSFAITPDCSTIYMPDGENSGDAIWYIVSAADGHETGTISFGYNPHNVLMSLDGSHVYFGARNFNFLGQVSTSSNTISKQIGPLIQTSFAPSGGVRPFTVDGRERYSFTTASGFLGFEVSDINTGNVLWTLQPSGFSQNNTQSAPSHGISLSPTDEHELYFIDWPNYVHVYDISNLPAQPTKTFDIQLAHSLGCIGWVAHSRDGRYVYVGCSGDVIDTSSHTLITGLPLSNDLASNRYYVEVDWGGGVPVFAMSSRMGQGYVTSSTTPPPPPPPPPPSSGAAISVAPSSFDFGTQHKGSTTGPLDVRITSVGKAPINIKSITVSGDFTMTNFCGSSLSPGFNCDVWVFFSPKATGTRTGKLTVTTDGSGPNTVSLTGTGQ